MPETLEAKILNDPLRNHELMVKLIAEATDADPSNVETRLQAEIANPGVSVASDFASRGIERYQWSDDLLNFYEQTDAFVYELAVWNRNRIKSGLRKWVVAWLKRESERLGRPLKALSVGDGLGFDTLALASAGHETSYFEVPGYTHRFATGLFKHAGASIEQHDKFEAIPTSSFDAIICLDVLEHVPDPTAYLKQIAGLLSEDAVIIASAPFHLILPAYPTHLASNRKYAGSLAVYRDAGLTLVGGKSTWDPLVFSPDRSRRAKWTHRLAIGLGGLLLAMGRLNSFPYRFVHWLRKKHNRPFH